VPALPAHCLLPAFCHYYLPLHCLVSHLTFTFCLPAAAVSGRLRVFAEYTWLETCGFWTGSLRRCWTCIPRCAVGGFCKHLLLPRWCCHRHLTCAALLALCFAMRHIRAALRANCANLPCYNRHTLLPAASPFLLSTSACITIPSAWFLLSTGTGAHTYLRTLLGFCIACIVLLEDSTCGLFPGFYAWVFICSLFCYSALNTAPAWVAFLRCDFPGTFCIPTCLLHADSAPAAADPTAACRLPERLPAPPAAPALSNRCCAGMPCCVSAERRC